MRIRVLYFGMLKDLVGQSSTTMELAEGSSVEKLVEAHRDLRPTTKWNSLAVAVNQEYAQASHILHDGDEVALLPPVSGGLSI